MQREDVERLATELERQDEYAPLGHIGWEAAAALRTLLAERDAAFAAGQRLFDAAATAKTLLAHSLMDGKIAPEMEDHFEAWLKELTGACSKEAGAALGIRALAIRDRPE